MRQRLVAAVAFGAALAAAGAPPAEEAKAPAGDPRPAASLPAVSGLAWMGGEVFLAVHDAKNPQGNAKPRVSLVRVGGPDGGAAWQPFDLPWPEPLGPSHDLESAARIPGTDRALLCESGDGGGKFCRIFVVEYGGARGVRLSGVVDWPAGIENVEGTAVAKVGQRLVFLYAERAHGRPGTAIRWAELTLDPGVTFGPFREVAFPNPDPPRPERTGVNRSVSALEADAAGNLYAASAYDPDADDGPFRSIVSRIGAVRAGAGGSPEVVLFPAPERVATLDGLKVEAIAIRETPGGGREIFAGTDDENFGGAIRRLPEREDR